MKLIVGLGNTGSAYAQTRHNVGFHVIDGLAREHGVALSQRLRAGRRVLAAFGDGQIGGQRVRLMCPQTMMNASGHALRSLDEWGVALPDLLVVCDDVNLPLGVLRIKPRGSAGGHKGLLSCIETLHSEQFARLRIGVGAQPLPNDLTEFVVSEFQADERPVIREATARAIDACAWWVTDGIHATMNRVNASPEVA